MSGIFKTIYIYACFVSLHHIGLSQVCSEGGRVVGLDLKEGSGDDFSANNTQIFHEYGGINCYGVVTEWRFYKSYSDCTNVFFQIWRPVGNDYMLVGYNLFDHVEERCEDVESGPVEFRIAKDKQIPVQPDDVIGWTSPSYNEMIEYSDNGTDIQSVKEICKDMEDRPIAPGFNTATCGDAGQLYREVSLQAIVETGPAPVFSNLPTVIQIPENSMHRSPRRYPDKVYDVKASLERNTAFNSLDVPLEFSFTEPQLYFNITTEFQNSSDFIADTQPYTGRISLAEPLDFESQREHVIPIRVDGLGLFAESTLTVQVIDLNEPHQITNLPFEATVNAETAKKGDVVFQMEVDDVDSNAEPLVYGIYSTDIADPPPPFVMDNKTGILRAAHDLYGMVLPTKYVLTLAAWDHMHIDIEWFVIFLENTRQDPVILNLNESIALPEDAPTGSDIFQVVAEGRYPNELIYSIAGVVPFQMYDKFIIDPQSGWISTTDAPDFNYADDTQWPIEIQVDVSDDVGMDTGFLAINLTWVNRRPMFVPSVYAADIPEKCGDEGYPGSVDNPICQLNKTHIWYIPGLVLNLVHRDESIFDPMATMDTCSFETDFETGFQSDFESDFESMFVTDTCAYSVEALDNTTCSIVPGFASSMFGIENCTYLYLQETIDVNDFPELMTINLTILAEDHYGLSDTAEVYITVYDINDHHPNFTKYNYTATIPENVPGGQSVLTVTARDHDFGENGTFVYSLDDSDNHTYKGEFYFQIHPFTGIIYTKHPIDYERLRSDTNGGSHVIFDAVATDKGLNRKSDRRRVYINVENLNDNRPRFDCHNTKAPWIPVDPNYHCFYNRETRSDAFENHTVLVLAAYDADFFRPNYYLLNPMHHFAISQKYDNRHRAELYTVDNLLNYHKYMMICMIEDKGGLKARPPAIARVDTYPPEKHLVDVTLAISINDFNDSSAIGSFMAELAIFIWPWYPRLEAIGVGGDGSSTTVTIYALNDYSTFLYDNLDKQKQFVHVNDLLRKLRENIQGDPTRNFTHHINSAHEPVLVMPAIPNWWIHTIAGLITTFFLLFLLLLLIVLGLVWLCRRCAWCCFRKKKHRPTTHAWMYDKRYLNQSDRDSDDDDDKGYPPEDYDCDCDNDSRNQRRARRDSTSTIHSQIYRVRHDD